MENMLDHMCDKPVINHNYSQTLAKVKAQIYKNYRGSGETIVTLVMTYLRYNNMQILHSYSLSRIIYHPTSIISS